MTGKHQSKTYAADQRCGRVDNFCKLDVEPHLRDIQGAAHALYCIQSAVHSDKSDLPNEYLGNALYLLSYLIMDNCEAIEKLLWPGSAQDDG